MDLRVAASHSSFAGCSNCFQQARLRNFPCARGLLQVQAAKVAQVKAPKDAELKKESRVGKAPILIPAGVSVKLDSDLLEIKVRVSAQESEIMGRYSLYSYMLHLAFVASLLNSVLVL